MRDRWLYAGVTVAALAAGFGLWSLDRPRSSAPAAAAATIGPAALYATTLSDEAGQPQALGQFQGRLLLINFWATWCAPCREEMPVLSDAAKRWGPRGVAILGLSAEPPGTVAAFRQRLNVAYPLWTGGAAVDELGRRLGNASEVLPYSVLVDAAGRVVDQRVGPYSPAALEEILQRNSAKTP